MSVVTCPLHLLNGQLTQLLFLEPQSNEETQDELDPVQNRVGSVKETKGTETRGRRIPWDEVNVAADRDNLRCDDDREEQNNAEHRDNAPFCSFRSRHLADQPNRQNADRHVGNVPELEIKPVQLG